MRNLVRMKKTKQKQKSRSRFLTKPCPSHWEASQNHQRKVSQLQTQNLDCSHLAIAAAVWTDYPEIPSHPTTKFHDKKSVQGAQKKGPKKLSGSFWPLLFNICYLQTNLMKERWCQIKPSTLQLTHFHAFSFLLPLLPTLKTHLKNLFLYLK